MKDKRLLADAPPAYSTSFKLSGQEVTNIPLRANETKRLTFDLTSLVKTLSAGAYPVAVSAQGGEARASVELTAEVVGQESLTLTTPDGRLSGKAEAGSETPLTLVVQNTGSAVARNIELNATKPSSWAVDFEPAQIDQIEPGQQVELLPGSNRQTKCSPATTS